MRLAKFSLQNYKCYTTHPLLSLLPGFNAIVGANNVGKTALLEGFKAQISANPHRSLAAVPRPTTPLTPDSTVKLSIVVSGTELRDYFLRLDSFFLLAPSGAERRNERGQKLLDDLLRETEIELHLGYRASAGSRQHFQTRSPSCAFYEADDSAGGHLLYSYRLDTSSRSIQCVGISSGDRSHDATFTAAVALSQNMYAFEAERLAIGEYAFGASSILRSDASNLAEALHAMQTTKPAVFSKYFSHLNEVFPGIAQISVRPKASAPNTLEIVVWNEEAATHRADLAFTLAESGTGIGQVMAMLYVVLDADSPQTIIIDEPNSFLHPAASRKLVEILRDFPEHQYILSTHSPELIRASEPSTIILLNRNGPATTVEQLDARSIDAQMQCLRSLGARLSDVFGADGVLWVEGATEEVCFPLILRQLGRLSSHEVISVLAVRSVSEIQQRSKRLELILDIYHRLSSHAALLPRTIGFVFDREGLSESERTDLNRASKGLMHFLPRRMFENYLLVPEALADLANSLQGIATTPFTPEDVMQWFVEESSNSDYYVDSKDPGEAFTKSWLEVVHGARLIDSLLRALSSEAQRYDKVRHAPLLVSSIAKRNPAHFAELTELITNVIHG